MTEPMTQRPPPVLTQRFPFQPSLDTILKSNLMNLASTAPDLGKVRILSSSLLTTLLNRSYPPQFVWSSKTLNLPKFSLYYRIN